MIKLVLVVAGVLALAAAPTFADDAPARSVDAVVGRIMARLDTDRDDRISRTEAEPAKRLVAHFDAIDADHDGFLSRAEISAALANARARRGK
jgi:hypothetical protein